MGNWYFSDDENDGECDNCSCPCNETEVVFDREQMLHNYCLPCADELCEPCGLCDMLLTLDCYAIGGCDVCVFCLENVITEAMWLEDTKEEAQEEPPAVPESDVEYSDEEGWGDMGR